MLESSGDVTTRTFGGIYTGSASNAKIALIDAVIVYQMRPAISEPLICRTLSGRTATALISDVLPGCASVAQAVTVPGPEIPALKPTTLSQPRSRFDDDQVLSASVLPRYSQQWAE